MFAGGAAGRQEPKQCLAGPTEKSTFVPRISESCGGFQAGSDVARLVRKIVLGSIVEDGRRGRSGDWGPVRGPLQQGMRGAFLTCGGSSEGEGREMDAEPFKL